METHLNCIPFYYFCKLSKDSLHIEVENRHLMGQQRRTKAGKSLRFNWASKTRLFPPPKPKKPQTTKIKLQKLNHQIHQEKIKKKTTKSCRCSCSSVNLSSLTWREENTNYESEWDIRGPAWSEGGGCNSNTDMLFWGWPLWPKWKGSSSREHEVSL